MPESFVKQGSDVEPERARDRGEHFENRSRVLDDDEILARIEKLSRPAFMLVRLLECYTGWATLDSIEGIATLIAHRFLDDPDALDDADSINAAWWMSELRDAGLAEVKDSRVDRQLIGSEPGLFRLRAEVPPLVDRTAAAQRRTRFPKQFLQEMQQLWFLERVELLAPQLRYRKERQAQRELDFEFPEYVAALHAQVEADPMRVIRAVVQLGDFWVNHGQISSGARLLRKALDRLGIAEGSFTDGPFDVVRGQSLLAYMLLRAEQLRNPKDYETWLAEQVERSLADPSLRRRDQFELSLNLVFVLMVNHQHQRGIELAETCRDLAVEIGDDYHAGQFSFFLSRLHEQSGDNAAALHHIERAIVHTRRCGVESFLASCFSIRTLLCQQELGPSQVARTLDEVLETQLRNRRVKDAVLTSLPLAIARFELGERRRALEVVRRALAIAVRTRNFDCELGCVVVASFTEFFAGVEPQYLEQCVRLSGGYRRFMPRFKSLFAPEYGRQVEEGILLIRSEMGAAQFERLAALASRQWQTVVSEAEELIRQQLSELEARDQQQNRRSASKQIETGTRVLTGREPEVLEAVLHGLSDKLIAEKLNLKPNTVRSYNSRIFRKFEVTSRSELMALFAVDQSPSALSAPSERRSS